MATERTDYPDDIEVQAWQCKVEAEMRCINCDALHGEHTNPQPGVRIVALASCGKTSPLSGSEHRAR